MIAIPALDIREGACVQLVGGSYEAERVRRDDPVAVAREWAEFGFRRLHLVDLDAATGRGSNEATVGAILRAVPEGVEVQVAGGIRDMDRAQALIEAGARWIIVGTRAVEDPAWLAELAERFPDRILVAADVRERRVVTRGWADMLACNVLDLVTELNGLSLAGVLVTAVHKEGRMQGTDLPLFEAVVQRARKPVLASGGIAALEDLRGLAARGVAAAVIGMALYTGALDPHVVAKEFDA